MLRQSGKNLRHLEWSFPLPKNHLRHSRSQRAMVIDLGEAQILKRQMAQLLHRLVRRNLSPPHLLEKFANGFRVQRSTQQSALELAQMFSWEGTSSAVPINRERHGLQP